jgi:hypothetical protein
MARAAVSPHLQLKRAGLDYWDNVHVNTHTSWDAFYAFFKVSPLPIINTVLAPYDTCLLPALLLWLQNQEPHFHLLLL